MTKTLRESLNNIVKSILIYRLTEYGFKVRKKKSNAITYYRGFWTDKDDFKYNIRHITRQVDWLVRYEIHPKCQLIVEIGDVGVDVVYRPESCEWYYNVYVEFGGDV